MEILLTWMILFALLPGIISAFIFSTAGRENGEFLAFIIGFLLSYLGVIIIVIITLASGRDESLIYMNETGHAYDLRPCPYCAEKIQIDAIKCRFCKEDVPKGKKAENYQDDWEDRQQEW